MKTAVFAIETGLFGCSELILLYLRSVAEMIINRYFATQQMAISTGYQYEMALEVTHNIWFALSLAVAAIYAVIIIFQLMKENKNEKV